MDQKKISPVSKLIGDREKPFSEVCDAVGVSRATLYRYLEPDGSPRWRTGQS
jgi:DNA-binding phage protein